MTEDERWKIEGRTRDALREARRNLALLKLDIEEHANKLKEASESLRNFLSNPTGTGPTGMTPTQYILHFYKTAIPNHIETKLREFESESSRASELETSIKAFDK